MIETICNQLAVTLPIHIFCYAPFLNHLRWGKKITVVLVAAIEAIYILLFGILLHDGISVSLIQLIAIPLFGIPFFMAVEMEPGKIMFLYVFSFSYLLAVRGTASYLEIILSKDSGFSVYSWQGSIISLILYILTMPFMLRYFRKTAQMVIETHAPHVWQKAWLLPLFNTVIVLLFTYYPQSASQINARFMLTRILLIICMFITYYFVINSINQLQQRITAEEHARYLKQLTDLQAAQYHLLQSRIEETRQARHDLRQHLRAIQGYIDKGNLTALASYVQAYGESIPGEALHEYCRNYAVDSVLSFYAERASAAGILMKISFCPLSDTIIPEPEFCVLLGNLLENAVDACCRQNGNA
ncbi:MAG: hypothetical protein Q4C91_09525 [Eubacteriales bacterium]|nr:hypothetical protein [Eubacteriales bacterium]